MPPDISKTLNDLKTVQQHIEQLTGLPSRWNGTLHITEEVDVENVPACRAKKEWGCSITLHAAYLDTPGLFQTIVHEMMHSVSVGLTPLGFRRFRGYEEGVVERLTRLLHPQIAGAMNIAVASETRDAFDNYILSLEQLRGLAQMDTHAFYLGLLQTPLEGREALVVQWAKQQYAHESEARVLARIVSLLRGLRGQG